MKEALNTKQKNQHLVKSHQTKNLSGMKFGKLLVTQFSHIGKHYVKYWCCVCECGDHKIIAGNHLQRGHTKSCGCISKVLKSTFKHGHHPKSGPSPEYISWQAMKRRALYSKQDHFNRYGGRGIKCCERWLNSFENFLQDMGPRPSLFHTLDRINNDGDYCPENCRWATKKQQARSRCSSRIIQHNGKSKTLAEWAEEAGMDLRSLWQRLKRGWDMEKSIKTPLDRKKQKLCA